MSKRIRDIISMSEIIKWKMNDIVTLLAGTGSGKSSFIKNELYSYAKLVNKKILILVHRSNCKEQFLNEIKSILKEKIITIKTYQKLEYDFFNNKEKIDLSLYDYIVCDEFHYFLSDSRFNENTEISLELILGQSNAVKIFMSATGEKMKQYIKDYRKLETKDYKLPIKYCFIKKLEIFHNDQMLYNLIEKFINTEEKAIFFMDSARKAYELYDKYKENCLFNCSKDNEDYYTNVDNVAVRNMLTKSKFDKKILITTTCMDAGVNIIDREVKNIVVSVKDIETLIQCIGRKRLQDENDKINLYIRSITNRQLGGTKRNLNKKLERARYLEEHTVKEYLGKFYKGYDPAKIVYVAPTSDEDKCTLKINELMKFKYEYDLIDIEEMIALGEFGYCKYIARKFGRSYSIFGNTDNREELEIYLQSLTGKALDSNQREELITKLNFKDKRGRVKKRIDKVNEDLKEKFSYTLTSETVKRKRYWFIKKYSNSYNI